MFYFFRIYPIEGASKEDAIIYVSILFSLAAVDGTDSKESDAVKNLVINNGWDSDIIELALEKKNITIESLNLSDEFIQIVGPYLIRDLCAIAHVSNGFSNVEDEHINSIRIKLGISEEKYLNIKKAVSSQIESIINWSKVISN